MHRRGDAVMDVVTSSCRTRTTKKTRRAAHSRRARPPPTATARPPMTDRTRVAKQNARYVVARGSALLQRPSARSRVAQSPPQPTSFVPCTSLLWSCVQANCARMRQRVVEERRQKAHAASQAAATCEQHKTFPLDAGVCIQCNTRQRQLCSLQRESLTVPLRLRVSGVCVCRSGPSNPRTSVMSSRVCNSCW